MRVSLLLSLQRKKRNNTEHPRCPGIRSFLSDQKGTEKVTATSEARGTAWGLHAPKTPKEEVESKKPGKMPGKTIFPSVFPILHC